MLDTKSWYYFIKSCRVSDDLAVVIYAFNPPPPRHPPYTTDYNQNCPSVNVKGKIALRYKEETFESFKH